MKDEMLTQYNRNNLWNLGRKNLTFVPFVDQTLNTEE
ncbi:hypothetical protein JOD20_003341 [Herpetosiphon giganteus]|nr:hypothetical protein [Herpetosiphon giganteus]